jgi:hypothetical protein
MSYLTLLYKPCKMKGILYKVLYSLHIIFTTCSILSYLIHYFSGPFNTTLPSLTDFLLKTDHTSAEEVHYSSGFFHIFFY